MPDRNEFETAAYLDAMRRRAVAALRWLDLMFEEGDMGGVVLEELRVQGPSKTGGDVRVIAKARAEDGSRFVAFANGATFEEALGELKRRADLKGIKWLEDRPYTPPK